MKMKLFEGISETGEATAALGRALGSMLCAGDLLLLTGELGAGKTLLTRGLVEGLGTTEGLFVASPTFVIMHRYPARLPVFHLDLYRLRGWEELDDLGFQEIQERREGVTIVEWADKFDLATRYSGAIRVTMRHQGQDRRAIEVSLPEKRPLSPLWPGFMQEQS